jgi:hypothetical protein
MPGPTNRSPEDNFHHGAWSQGSALKSQVRGYPNGPLSSLVRIGLISCELGVWLDGGTCAGDGPPRAVVGGAALLGLVGKKDVRL